ncbi:MAG: hypothetical protein N2235_09350 [Fischerella sp.]|nr:hypothetical protein [Fischerella sp.]
MCLLSEILHHEQEKKELRLSNSHYLVEAGNENWWAAATTSSPCNWCKIRALVPEFDTQIRAGKFYFLMEEESGTI